MSGTGPGRRMQSDRVHGVEHPWGEGWQTRTKVHAPAVPIMRYPRVHLSGAGECTVTREQYYRAVA